MDLLQQFIIFLSNRKNKPSFLTLKNYKADIRQFISWFETTFKISFDPSRVTPEILYDYEKTKNLSKKSMNRHYSSLRNFFNFLKERRDLTKNPLEKNITQIQAQELKDPWRIKSFKSSLHDRNKSNLTIKNYIYDLKNFFKWFKKVSTEDNRQIEDKNLPGKINSSIIEQYRQSLTGANFSQATVNRKICSLKSYLSWFKNQEAISFGATKSHLGTSTAKEEKVRLSDPKFLAFIKEVSDIKRRFHAPAASPAHVLPAYKKIWQTIRHTRPNWYKGYHSHTFAHYLHFAILMIFGCILWLNLYNNGIRIALLTFSEPTHNSSNSSSLTLTSRSTKPDNASNSMTGYGSQSAQQVNPNPTLTVASTNIGAPAKFIKIEYYQTDKSQTAEEGTILCLKNNKLMAKCDSDNKNIIGVVSSRLDNKHVIICLSGAIETLVSIADGAIKTGDMLTTSEISGVATRTAQANLSIGKSLESLITTDEAKIIGYYNPGSKEYRSKESLSNIPLKSNIVPIAKIPVLINIIWHNPNIRFSENGKLVIASTSDKNLSLAERFLNATIAVTIKTVIVNALGIKTNMDNSSSNATINNQGLKEQVFTVMRDLGLMKPKILSPIAQPN